MNTNEQFKDWLFRYQYLYKKRASRQTKHRFISALVSDIVNFRDDISVIEYNVHRKYSAKNIYVGDIQKAKQIICTYYDTPIRHMGAYQFFDRTEQRKRTIQYILLSSILLIVLGLFGTIMYMKMAPTTFQMFSIQTVLVALIFGVFFFFLGKFSKGFPQSKTLVRNTSSILTILEMIKRQKKKDVAYAFLDEGSLGDNGLIELLKECSVNANIVFLDCVGANQPLHYLSQKNTRFKSEIEFHKINERVSYLISAEEKGTDAKGFKLFQLAPIDLKAKELNMTNIETSLIFLMELSK
ncbi:hypothetical protein M2901_01450 [Vagococcus lutrae]|uniref:hypothetical protein n=1 Tax=Vagococcus lutrae TaxID=81947 RepID=UPI00200BD283|nr:hypothetical protein [Vagococcus lutrae]UQF71329.1 hypothetical protein M2901_01450 [Vagococcus lutrae]